MQSEIILQPLSFPFSYLAGWKDKRTKAEREKNRPSESARVKKEENNKVL